MREEVRKRSTQKLHLWGNVLKGTGFHPIEEKQKKPKGEKPNTKKKERQKTHTKK